MLATSSTGLGAIRSVLVLIPLLAASIGGVAGAQTSAYAFIVPATVNGTSNVGRHCYNAVGWPSAWAFRVPDADDLVLAGAVCATSTLVRRFGDLPDTQRVVGCTSAATTLNACDAQAASFPANTWRAPPPPPDPMPTATLTVNPSSIVLGNVATLTWTSTDATSCTAGGAWSGAKLPSGSEEVSPSSDSQYTLTCSGPGGFSEVELVAVAVTGPTAPVCVPAQFGGTGTPFVYADTKLPDGSTDVTGPAVLVFFCGTTAHWIAGSPFSMLAQMQAVWNAVPWRATTPQERAFALQVIEANRP